MPGGATWAPRGATLTFGALPASQPSHMALVLAAARCPQMSSDDRPRSKIRAEDGAGSHRYAHGAEFGRGGQVSWRLHEDTSAVAEATGVRSRVSRGKNRRISTESCAVTTSVGAGGDDAAKDPRRSQCADGGQSPLRILHSGSDEERHGD